MRKKDLFEIIITALLLVVLVIVGIRALRKAFLRNAGRKVGAESGQSLSLSGKQPSAAGENKNFYNFLEQQSASIELKRDPFTAAPIAAEKDLRAEFTLTGILWDKDKPLAIINDEVVKVGERVGNKMVVDIKKDRVTLSDGVALSELRLE